MSLDQRSTPEGLIAIDWGTTSARAYLLDKRGNINDQHVLPLGISQVKGGQFEDALLRLTQGWNQDLPRLACGMIGSRQGWKEAPYVDCPASFASLAGKMVQVDQLSIVPGLITHADETPDVMRGEETQLLGTIDPHEPLSLAVLPGTHSKWAIVDRGTIVDFATFMTGELYSVLLQHSILGRMAEPPSHQTSAQDLTFQRGLVHGMQSLALLHDMFAARTLALMGKLQPAEVRSWLSGLLIGREVQDGLAWGNKHGIDLAETTVKLIGDDTLAERYVIALQHINISTVRCSSQAAAMGLWKIAQQTATK